MKQNKKGFTLIELLAVIVILAIIALIATPIILNMINDAKKSAAKDSAYGYLDAAEKYVVMNQMSSNGVATEYNVAPVDGKECSVTETTGDCAWIAKLNSTIKGSKPTAGTITVNGTNVTVTDITFNGEKFSTADLQGTSSQS